MKIKITADSTCDLPPQMVAAHDICLTPLSVVLGEQSFTDRLEISPAQLFAYMADSRNTCLTSAHNVAGYEQVFREYQHYDAIIHISLSSQLSCSYDNAKQAAAGFENVYVVDSANLCGGSGLLAERAALAVAAGLDAPKIVADLNELVKKVESNFIINSLEYLKRGGRCSALSEFGANLLQMKLSIRVREGHLQVGKKYRGTFDKCVKKFLTDQMQERQDIDDEVIYLAGAALEPTLFSQAKEIIAETGYFKRIIELEAGCVISCHCGPGALGVFFLKK